MIWGSALSSGGGLLFKVSRGKTRTRSLDVSLVMQGIFARHGIPNLVISDNGPQFSSEEFKEFSKRYQFSHQTSSPRHPQANGLVERTVGIVTSILKKAKQANEDPHLALLAYRTTGHEVTGVSPGQLLMGRRLRTTLPMIPSQLQPQLVDDNLIRYRHDLCKTQQARYYNQRHGVSLLPELEAGEKGFTARSKDGLWKGQWKGKYKRDLIK